MDKDTFEQIDHILNEIDDTITQLLASPESEKLRNLLSQLNKSIDNRYAVSLLMDVDIFDKETDRCMPLLQTGMSGFDTEEPYQVSGDSALQSYIVDGEMMTVPHDRCPKCWEIWDFKFKGQSCEHCGATMGNEVKLLLDNDLCPWCNDGQVTMSNPACDKCGYHVDPSHVVWG